MHTAQHRQTAEMVLTSMSMVMPVLQIVQELISPPPSVLASCDCNRIPEAGLLAAPSHSFLRPKRKRGDSLFFGDKSIPVVTNPFP